MKQNSIGIRGLIAVVLMPQLVSQMLRIEKLGKFIAKFFDLFLGQYFNTRNETMLLKELQLFVAQLKRRYVGIEREFCEQVGDGSMFL